MKAIVLLLIGFIFSACNYADMGGMFVVNESVNERFEQSVKANNLTGDFGFVTNSDDYQLVVMGDVHIGGTENFDKAIEQIKVLNPIALVLDGDICNGNAEDYETLEQHLPEKTDLMYFMLAGNHELYFGGWNEYYSRFGSSSYYFTVKTPVATDLFICLDTGSGTLGSKQLAWFKKLLVESRLQYRRCIVFTHNNLYRIRHTLSTNPTNEELLVLTELFAKYKVDMVVTGHDHFKNVIKLGNTTHITMNALHDGFMYAGYFQINIIEGQVNYEFVDIN
jgi:3',5'-cyclic AMP phosphodiesterase CpdA